MSDIETLASAVADYERALRRVTAAEALWRGRDSHPSNVWHERLDAFHAEETALFIALATLLAAGQGLSAPIGEIKRTGSLLEASCTRCGQWMRVVMPETQRPETVCMQLLSAHGECIGSEGT